MTLSKQHPEQITKTETLFSPEEISNISAFGDILRQVRARLKSEGISIESMREHLRKNPLNYKNLCEMQNKITNPIKTNI